ncbi:thioredoxin [Candidatus Falkowbacteria bacterium]|nr:thioredoxin [Candidatus Falkowbacteria bacterium]
MAKELNKDNFEKEVVEASKEKPALVDFFAPWCGPCQMQGPIIDEVAEELGDKAVVVKVNIDDNPELAEKYGVMSIPTLILFKDGKAEETMTGMQAKENLMKLLS